MQVRIRRWCISLFQVQLVEGASGDWIPKLKEQFGIKTFDLVFLDHWKDRYLPDTKLIEVSSFGLMLFESTSDCSAMTLTLLLLSGVRPPPERQRPAGGQRHLPRNSWLPGVRPEQPAIQKPILQISPGVHQSGGRLGEVCLLRVALDSLIFNTGTSRCQTSDVWGSLCRLKTHNV